MAGALNDVATGIGQIQELKSSNNSNSNSSGGTTNSNSGSGCNCANLQSMYDRWKRQAGGNSDTYTKSRNSEIVGGALGQGEKYVDKDGNVTYGDVGLGNATLKSTAGKNMRDAQREMQNLESKARKCGCTLR